MKTSSPQPSDYLYDLELPSTGFNGSGVSGVLLIVIAVLFVLMLAWYHYQRQQPIARAKRQLRLLSTSQPDPQALAFILRQGLQVPRLKHSTLPKDFQQRLDAARFAATPCHPTVFIRLKDDAQRFLEQQKEQTK